MEILRHFWWLIILFLIGIVYNTMKSMLKVNHRRYLNMPKQDHKVTYFDEEHQKQNHHSKTQKSDDKKS